MSGSNHVLGLLHNELFLPQFQPGRKCVTFVRITVYFVLVREKPVNSQAVPRQPLRLGWQRSIRSLCTRFNTFCGQRLGGYYSFHLLLNLKLGRRYNRPVLCEYPTSSFLICHHDVLVLIQPVRHLPDIVQDT